MTLWSGEHAAWSCWHLLPSAPGLRAVGCGWGRSLGMPSVAGWLQVLPWGLRHSPCSPLLGGCLLISPSLPQSGCKRFLFRPGALCLHFCIILGQPGACSPNLQKGKRSSRRSQALSEAGPGTPRSLLSVEPSVLTPLDPHPPHLHPPSSRASTIPPLPPQHSLSACAHERANLSAEMGHLAFFAKSKTNTREGVRYSSFIELVAS